MEERKKAGFSKKGELALNDSEGSPSRRAIRCEKDDHLEMAFFSYSWPKAGKNK
jgi:hypothetical protein